MAGTMAGSFDRVVEIGTYSAAVDSKGFPKPGGSWSTLVKCLAKRSTQMGKEVEAGGAVTPVAEVEWIIRWVSTEIKASHILRYKNETYQIIAPPMELGRQDSLKLLTRIVRPGGKV